MTVGRLQHQTSPPCSSGKISTLLPDGNGSWRRSFSAHTDHLTPPEDDARLIPYTHEGQQEPPAKIAGSLNTLSKTSSSAVSTSQTVSAHANPRRTQAHTTGVPRLQRDTERTAEFVQQIVTFTNHLIGCLWQHKTSPTSVRDNSGNAVLPLTRFIQETLKRSKTSYTTLQIALIYLVLLKESVPTAQHVLPFKALHCGRRMFLTSLITASKYIQDRNYSARAWSKISGLDLQQIKDNECKFLDTVAWNLHVPKESFENWVKITQWTYILSNPYGSSVGWRTLLMRPPRLPSLAVSSTDPAQQFALRAWWGQTLAPLQMAMLKSDRATYDFLAGLKPFVGIKPSIGHMLAPAIVSQDHDSSAAVINMSCDPSYTKTACPVSIVHQPTDANDQDDCNNQAILLERPMPKNLPTPSSLATTSTPYSTGSNTWTPCGSQIFTPRSSGSTDSPTSTSPITDLSCGGRSERSSRRSSFSSQALDKQISSLSRFHEPQAMLQNMIDQITTNSGLIDKTCMPFAPPAPAEGGRADGTKWLNALDNNMRLQHVAAQRALVDAHRTNLPASFDISTTNFAASQLVREADEVSVHSAGTQDSGYESGDSNSEGEKDKRAGNDCALHVISAACDLDAQMLRTVGEAEFSPSDRKRRASQRSPQINGLLKRVSKYQRRYHNQAQQVPETSEYGRSVNFVDFVSQPGHSVQGFDRARVSDIL